MIESFIKHSNAKAVDRLGVAGGPGITKEDAQYLIYLLEGFVNLTFSDMGIEPLLGKNAILQFTKLLDNAYAKNTLEEMYGKIAELCLRVLGNMSINHEGK